MDDTNDIVIQTFRLTKIFRDFWLREKVTAVSELDLTVHRKEVFGLLGPNGSGKSTTIKMLLGLLFPTSGRVTIFGCAPTDVGIKARIGFLPEESYLYPFLDAWETLDFYGRLFHQPRRERMRRIGKLLEMVGLSSVAYRRVGEYSKGMQRRIGLAQALINDPDLLILDEPTSGMDPVGSRQFKDLIHVLAQRGKTILLSSHLLADVEDVSDRVCILYGGRVRSEGRIEDLLGRHALTQITAQRLDDATLARVRQVLQQAGCDVVDVTTPRDKLEALFLRIVQEAQRKKLATGGAVAGEVADFLRTGESDSEQLIQELVHAAQPAPAAPAAVEPAAVEPARNVLDELVEEKPAPPPTAVSPVPPPPGSPLRQDRADRSVLDELMGQGQAEENDRP